MSALDVISVKIKMVAFEGPFCLEKIYINIFFVKGKEFLCGTNKKNDIKTKGHQVPKYLSMDQSLG